MKHLIVLTDRELGQLRQLSVAAGTADTELVALGAVLEGRALTGERIVNALTGASHALRSYQFGNAATDLAEDIANACDEALSLVERPAGLATVRSN